MAISYDISSKVGSLFERLEIEKDNLFEVYIKIGNNESLSCYMTHSEKSSIEHNFYMGNPFPITVLDEDLNELYTIQVNTKNIQFIRTKKVRIPRAV